MPWHRRDWFIMRALRRCLSERVGALALGEGARVLDYGCATSPYRDLFTSGVQYVGADLPGNPAAQLHIDAEGRVPDGNGAFDAVLSTQVLEHVADPGLYLQECWRLLRPGGALLLTTHGLWIYHPDPVDYWRWTSAGLRRTLERAGFEIEHVEGLMGLSAVAVQLFQDATHNHVPRRLRNVYRFCLQRLVAWCDRFHSTQSRVDNAMVYVVVARKSPAIDPMTR